LLLMLKVLVFALKEVEGFCYYFWMLKVFVVSFECGRFLLIFFNIEGSYFHLLMLKVITPTLRCSKFLLLVLDVESPCSYSWYWRFLLLLFLCYKVELSLCFNPSTSKLCLQGKFFSKVPKIIIQFTWL
jgi:hypothetical protein